MVGHFQTQTHGLWGLIYFCTQPPAFVQLAWRLNWTLSSTVRSPCGTRSPPLLRQSEIGPQDMAPMQSLASIPVSQETVGVCGGVGESQKTNYIVWISLRHLILTCCGRSGGVEWHSGQSLWACDQEVTSLIPDLSWTVSCLWVLQ